MQTYLEKFKKLQGSEDPHRIDKFLAEIEAAIEAHAEVTDHFKKQLFIWNKKTSELCTIRDMMNDSKKKENENGD